MNLRQLWSLLLAEGVRVWLDSESKLRIDSDALPETKALVRESKALLTSLLEAQELVNDSGIRLVRVVGGFALAKLPGELSPQLVDALRVLEIERLPLVHNTEGGDWVDYESWRCQRVTTAFYTLFDKSEVRRWIELRQAERDARLSA